MIEQLVPQSCQTTWRAPLASISTAGALAAAVLGNWVGGGTLSAQPANPTRTAIMAAIRLILIGRIKVLSLLENHICLTGPVHRCSGFAMPQRYSYASS
jgi:hypothetical protein